MRALANLQNDFTNNIAGYSTIAIILSTCLGAVAIMQTLTFGNGMLQMFFVTVSVIVCSMHNASIITVQKPILIYRLLQVSTIVNSLILLGALLLK